MSRIAAVLLAGGRAERMGGANKTLLEMGGRRIIDRLVEALVGCEPVLLSVGRGDFALPGLVPVRDLDGDYEGPLAGFAAAVAHLLSDPPDFLLSVAGDTPFFPADFVAGAMPLLAEHDAVLGAYAGQDYPTNSIWRFESVRALPAGIIDGTAPHSLKRLAERLRTARLDYAAIDADDPFLNANTPEDLALLRDRADRARRG